eukprot:TRINITY_DN3540_c0_g1_i2.p1 TRINITY_DN3540_c0_g1~~TRINITY_DN3540_c0_g1_i2.p1  ORF type:complete len:225 (-),score=39.44 TRINITY_DN3540_c0_g1_i2:2015-2689(-)
MGGGAEGSSGGTDSRCSVLVIGTGAVGCLYGARLLEAGHDVTFLLRSDYAAAKTHGLTLKSADGDMYLPPDSPRLRSTTEGMQPVDWLVLGLKAYALKHARELAGQCYGARTRVLAITNGLCDDDLALAFGKERTFGAIVYVCVTRAAPAVIHHLHYGDLLIGKVAQKRMFEVYSEFKCPLRDGLYARNRADRLATRPSNTPFAQHVIVLRLLKTHCGCQTRPT